MRRVLFTGSRDYTDEYKIRQVINSLPLDAVVMHGGARGADAIVDRLARARGLPVRVWEAEWGRYRLKAGPIRNQKMLEEGKPTEAHAFPLMYSKGTWDMIRRLVAAGVPTTVHE